MGKPLGDYLEFGVFNGTSLACMHAVTKSLGACETRLFGFDSFEGLPPDCVDEASPWPAGAFNSSEEFTRAVLTEEGVDWNRVTLMPGRFSNSLNDDVITRYRIERCSVIMVDCDLYASAQQALAFCAPLITDNAIIVFDDWPADESGYQGENVAYAEFLAAHCHFASTKLDLAYSRNSAVFLIEPYRGAERA
jgi:O-methyltransferase